MAMSPVMKVFLVIGEFLSIIFLVIGIFIPAWIKYEIRIYTDTIPVSIGLWRMTVCIHGTCESGSINRYIQRIEESGGSSAIENAAADLLKSFLTTQVLCVLGGLAALVGASLVFTYIKQLRTCVGNKQLMMAVAGVILNMIAGILVISAVAIQAGRNKSFKDDIDAAMMIRNVRREEKNEMLFPWAILVSGIGALMVFVLGLIFGISLFVKNYDKSCLHTTNTRNQLPVADYNRGANLAECHL